MARSTSGLSGRSTTGTWVALASGRVFGPFDGRTPAQAFGRAMVERGYDCEICQMWAPAEALA